MPIKDLTPLQKKEIREIWSSLEETIINCDDVGEELYIIERVHKEIYGSEISQDMRNFYLDNRGKDKESRYKATYSTLIEMSENFLLEYMQKYEAELKFRTY